jgi:PKD repeat protein
VRYFWDFGDGAQDDKPDVVHRYGFPGEYSVVHIVTSSGGAEATCTKDVFVE